MSNQRNRPWYAIHVSTALVMLLLAGFFVRLNTRKFDSPRQLSIHFGTPADLDCECRGWPLDYIEVTEAQKLGIFLERQGFNTGTKLHIIWKNLIIDAVIALSAVIIIGGANEIRARSKEAPQ